RRAELRRDQHVVTPPPERAAEILLAERAAVDVGGVEERDPGVERRVDDGDARSLVEAPAEVVATEADHRPVAGTAPAGLHHMAPSLAVAGAWSNSSFASPSVGSARS